MVEETQKFIELFFKLNSEEKDIFSSLNMLIYGDFLYIQYISSDKENNQKLIDTISEIQQKIRRLINSENELILKKIDKLLNELRMEIWSVYRDARSKPDNFKLIMSKLRPLVYEYQSVDYKISNYLTVPNLFRVLSFIFLFGVVSYLTINSIKFVEFLINLNPILLVCSIFASILVFIKMN
jgi:hypothetical protein